MDRAFKLGGSCGIEKVILATDEETVRGVQDDLSDGSKQLWNATQNGKFVACVITQVTLRETGPVLEIKYMAGEKLTEWFEEAASVLRPLAREAGCVAIYANTREGLRKYLVDHGWKKVSVRMRLDLDGR